MRCDFERSDLFNVVSAGAVSRRNRLVFTANPLQVWPLNEDVEAPRLPSAISPVHCLRLSYDERTIAVATGEVVKLVELSSGRDLRTLVGHRLPVQSICGFNRSIYNWITGSADASCIVWDIRKHPANQLTLRASGPVKCVQISPDDSILIVGSDFSLQIFDLRQRRLLKQIGNVSVSGASFHPSECLLATFGSDRIVRFWDLDSYECVSTSEPCENDIKSAGFVPNGDLLMTSTDAKLRLLTWEPCNVLGTVDLPNQSKVVNVFTTEDSVDILCSFADRSVSLYRTTYEDVLTLPEEVSDCLDSDSLPHSLPESPLRLSPSGGSESADSEGNSVESTIEDTEDTFLSVPCQDVEFEVTVQPVVEKKSPARPSPIIAPSLRSSRPNSVSGPTTPTKRRPPMGSKPVVPRKDPLPPRPTDDRKKDREEPRKKPVSTLERRREGERRGSVPRLNSKDRDAEEKPAKSTEEELLSFIVSKHASVYLDLEDKQRGITRLRDMWKRRGVEEALHAIGSDRFLTCQLLQQIGSSGRWTVAVAAQVIPRIRVLLTDRSPHIRSCALVALTKVITQLGDAIRMSARNAPSIGVDVAGEQRHANAVKCTKELLDMQINTAFLTDQMTTSEVHEFEALMALVDGQ